MFEENKTAPVVDDTGNAESDASQEDNSETGSEDGLLDEYDNPSQVEDDSVLDEEDDDSDDTDDDDADKDWETEAKTLKKRYGNSTKEAQRLVKENKILKKHANDVAPVIKAIKDNPKIAKELGKTFDSKPDSDTTKDSPDERIDKIEAELNDQKLREVLRNFEESHSDIKFTAPIRAKISAQANLYLDEGMSKKEALEEALKDIKRRLGIKSSQDSIQDDQKGVSVGSNDVGQRTITTLDKDSVPKREMQDAFDRADKSHLGPLVKKANKK